MAGPHIQNLKLGKLKAEIRTADYRTSYSKSEIKTADYRTSYSKSEIGKAES
jgi:hypothetical protein